MEPDAGWSRDPGWREALQGAWVFVIPFGLQLRLRKMQRDGADGLVVMRSVFLAFIGGIVLIGIVVSFLGAGLAGTASSSWFAAGLVVYGGVMIFIVSPRVERRLPCDSDAAMAGAFRTRFFLRIALSESVALIGFVLVFRTGAVWLYYVGALVALIGFARGGPTVRNLEADQTVLHARGCDRSLVAALRRPQDHPGAG